MMIGWKAMTVLQEVADQGTVEEAAIVEATGSKVAREAVVPIPVEILEEVVTLVLEIQAGGLPEDHPIGIVIGMNKQR
jgi:hypothetical protein